MNAAQEAGKNCFGSCGCGQSTLVPNVIIEILPNKV